MLFVEHVGPALNARQGLTAGRPAIDIMRQAGLDAVHSQFHQALSMVKHAVYEVRRAVKPSAKPVNKGVKWRPLRAIGHGSRSAMGHYLPKLLL